jgi:hypothetical protein
MKIDTFSCDICDNMKDQANHWFKLGTNETFDSEITITAWDVDTDFPMPMHLCSDACVLKAVQRWLTEQQKENPA